MEICWFMICWFQGLDAFQPPECLRVCLSARVCVWSRPQCALGCTRVVVTLTQQLESGTDEEFQSFVYVWNDTNGCSQRGNVCSLRGHIQRVGLRNQQLEWNPSRILQIKLHIWSTHNSNRGLKATKDAYFSFYSLAFNLNVKAAQTVPSMVWKTQVQEEALTRPTRSSQHIRLGTNTCLHHHTEFVPRNRTRSILVKTISGYFW